MDFDVMIERLCERFGALGFLISLLLVVAWPLVLAGFGVFCLFSRVLLPEKAKDSVFGWVEKGLHCLFGWDQPQRRSYKDMPTKKQ